MAHHTTLPIYQKARQLLTLVLNLPKDMRKDARFLIGRELLRESLAIMKLIRRMNMTFGTARVAYLDELLEKLQFIEDLVTSCDDTHLISPALYEQVTKVTQNLGKQANGLKNHAQR
jgi:hypothetical protein